MVPVVAPSPSVQCAAVIAHSPSSREAPHTLAFAYRSDTQLCSKGVTAVPPTMRARPMD